MARYRGFARLKLVASVTAGVATLFWAARIDRAAGVSWSGSEGGSEGLFALGFAIGVGVFTWGVVRIIQWIVDGFCQPKMPSDKY